MPSSGGKPAARRAWVLSLVCAVLSAASLAAPQWIYPDRPALVHVRWAPGVDDAGRRDLEARYRLTRPARREGTTWAYYVADTSRGNLRALIGDAAVEDTHNINRNRFTIWRTAPRDPYRGPGAGTLPGVLELLAWMLGASALAAALVAVAPRATLGKWASLRGVGAAGRRWTANLLSPPASAEAVAVFRVAFGLALLAIVLRQPIAEDTARAVVASTDPGPFFGPLWRALAAWPPLATWMQVGLLVALCAFIAGARARLAYAIVCAGMVAWAWLYSARSSGHPYSALVLAVLALTAAPWADAWSVDEHLRRRAGRRALRRSPDEYGYAVWVPGLVLGVCLLAAAVAKLREGGLEWITNGTVKYHFLTDSPSAMVQWGPRLGLYPTLAVVASAAAIAIEVLVIAGALSRAYAWRAAAGVLAALFLVGFLLFQGLFWPGWWVLLLSFLPWHLVRGTGQRVAATPAPGTLRRVQIAVVAAVLLQQLAVSIARVEAPPFASAYDMYSSTYASASEYEADSGMSYWLIAREAGAPDRPCEVSRQVAEAWLDEARRVRDGEGLRAAQVCFGDGASRARQLVVEGRRTRVDWQRWRLDGEEQRVLAGPFPW